MYFLTKVHQAAIALTAWKIVETVADSFSKEAKAEGLKTPEPCLFRLRPISELQALPEKPKYHLIICHNCKTLFKNYSPPEGDIFCSKCGCTDNVRYEVISKSFYDRITKMSYPRR